MGGKWIWVLLALGVAALVFYALDRMDWEPRVERVEPKAFVAPAEKKEGKKTELPYPPEIAPVKGQAPVFPWEKK